MKGDKSAVSTEAFSSTHRAPTQVCEHEGHARTCTHYINIYTYLFILLSVSPPQPQNKLTHLLNPVTCISKISKFPQIKYKNNAILNLSALLKVRVINPEQADTEYSLYLLLSDVPELPQSTSGC